MNAKFIKIILAAMVALSLAACSYNDSTVQAENWYSFTDHSGNTVALAQKPQKVAVLFSSFADIWVTAGGSVDITVGESVQRGFAPEDAVLVDAGAGKSINTELLIASKPDFVICSADVPAQQEAAKLLNGAGVPCAVFRVENFDDYLSVLDIFTDITGSKERYKLYGTDVRQNIEQLMLQTEQFAQKVRLLGKLSVR
jgi:iron complex transport system substrate-binding protein